LAHPLQSIRTGSREEAGEEPAVMAVSLPRSKCLSENILNLLNRL
jgi:hypothetical protein